MTHDELLKELFVFKVKSAGYSDSNEPHSIIKALEAVVELHKPVEGKFGLSCLKCRDYENYPCSTIQAIEKELV